MATFGSGWLASILGVLLRDSAGEDIGRSDVLNVGDGLTAVWDAVAKEFTLALAWFSGGVLNLQGYALTNFCNFRTAVGPGVNMTGGAAMADVLTFATGMTGGYSARIGVRVEIYETGTLATGGFAEQTVTAYAGAAALTLSSTAFSDKSGLPAGADCEFAVDGFSLKVRAKPTANACHCRVWGWMQPAELREA